MRQSEHQPEQLRSLWRRLPRVPQAKPAPVRRWHLRLHQAAEEAEEAEEVAVARPGGLWSAPAGTGPAGAGTASETKSRTELAKRSGGPWVLRSFARGQADKRRGGMEKVGIVNVSIESVLRIHLSEIEEYDSEDEDEDEDQDDTHFRTLTISTGSGILELELSAASAAALEVVADV